MAARLLPRVARPAVKFLSTCAVKSFVRTLLLLMLALSLGPMASGVRADTGMVGGSPARIVLDDAPQSHQAWPAVTVWADPSGRADVRDVLLRLGEFHPPGGMQGNLGVHQGAIWMHIPVQVPVSERGRWVFSLDYPAMDRIDLYTVSDARVVQHQVMGDLLPMSQRPLAARVHAARLSLEPGQHHELLVRLESTSTLIAPIELALEDHFRADEAADEAGQGLLAGVALCLVLYSLAQWLLVRESAYAFYAVNVLGVGLFFVNQFGLAAQHLWGESVWMLQKVSPIAVLLAEVGGMMFVDRVLGVRQLAPQMSWVMRALSALALGVAALFALGVVDYPVAGLTATMLGPVPMVLAMPAAWIRTRRGDRAALFILLGWGLYAAGVVVMAAFLRGHAPVNFWTQHALQFASTAEMVMWMLVLGVRTESIRSAAESARQEQDRLSRLASTDPLTGVLNRRGLQQALAARLATALDSRVLALYVLDLDGFKPVNDLLGHDAGDELLVAVARRLRECMRESDLVARVGGDEFVVAADALSDAATAQRIGQKLLGVFAEPFEIDGAPCRVGATIGYALAPAEGRDAADLLKRADAAMYLGKQSGKLQVRRLEPQALQPA